VAGAGFEEGDQGDGIVKARASRRADHFMSSVVGGGHGAKSAFATLRTTNDRATMNQSEFLALALRNPTNQTIADALFELALPDAWIVAGCLVQSAWNGLTGRAVDYGISDYDVFYFDEDVSWQAEDTVIRRVQDRLTKPDVTVEVRNQARVHLWYPQKHGRPYPALTCSTDGIDRFLTQNTQVGIRRTADGYDVYAPHGFDDIAGMIVRPNAGANFSRANYEEKAARWKALWPEIRVMPAESDSPY
jgi:hypothetical protein